MKSHGTNITLDGSRSEYRFQTVSSEGGAQSLMLVGTSPKTQGQAISLSGKQVIDFADTTLKIADTVFGAAGLGAQQASSEAQSTVQPPPVFSFSPFALDSGDDPDADQVLNSETLLTHASQKFSGRQSVPRSNPSVDAHDDPTTQETQRDVAKHPPAKFSQVNDRTESLPSTPSAEGGQSTRNPPARPIDTSMTDSSVMRSASGGLSEITRSNSAATPAPSYQAVRLFGTAGNDNLVGEFGDDVFFTSSGVDRYVGKAGLDTLIGVEVATAEAVQISPGVFSVRGSFSHITKGRADQPEYGARSDGSQLTVTGVEFFAGVEGDSITKLAQIAKASAFDDELMPLQTGLSWVMDAMAGNDIVIGGANADTLIGGDGDDTISSGENDLATHASGRERLAGGAGNDTITFQLIEGEDDPADPAWQLELDGGTGNDQFNVTLSSQVAVRLDGGSGVDRLSVALASSPSHPFDPEVIRWGFNRDSNGVATFSARFINSAASANMVEVVPSIEYLSVGIGTNDFLKLVRPSSVANTLSGTDESEIYLPVFGEAQIVRAAGGNDIVIAESGSEVSLGAGFNTFFGLSSDVTLDYSGTPIGIRANLSNGLVIAIDDSADIWALDRLRTAASQINGSGFNDQISGSQAAEYILGGGGADVLIGGGGFDVLEGGAGNDSLTIAGMDGGRMSGGSGRDTFNINSDLSGLSLVTVSDFSAEDDVLRLFLDEFSESTGIEYSAVDWIDYASGAIFETTSLGGAGDHLSISIGVLDDSAAVYAADNNLPFLQLDFGDDALSAAQVAAMINVDYL
ncbi:RTX calcium-binding nonapeptide repeat [Oxalobacteraceae bacterium]